MKINGEDYLHAIDKTFEQKAQKDINMIYIMLVAIIFGFSYSLFWDSSVEELLKTEKSVSRLKQKIDEDQMFLRYNPETRLLQLDKDISAINSKIIINKDNNSYIKSKIETISSLIYDERTWGEYIDSISKNAQRYNVKIKSFTNQYASTGHSFGHILDITISATANYKNTLNFINSLEQSDLVIDLHTMKITAAKELQSDLNISVWGITY